MTRQDEVKEEWDAATELEIAAMPAITEDDVANILAYRIARDIDRDIMLKLLEPSDDRGYYIHLTKN